MPELAMVEVFAWPLLAAGFAWFFRGKRAAALVFPAALALMIAALWFGSDPESGNRAMLARMGEAALWAVGLGIPAFFYARVVAKARRAARERER